MVDQGFIQELERLGNDFQATEGKHMHGSYMLAAAVKLREMACAPAHTSPQQPHTHETKWPSARDVGRYGDMSPHAHLRIGLDNDNDVYVQVWGEDGGASVEFCNGGSGGGASPKTRLALIATMLAMEEENSDRPDKDWWARRMGQSLKSKS